MGDDDSDERSNGAEYAFGLNPTDPGLLRAVIIPAVTSEGFRYTRRDPTIFATGLKYRYQYSTTLMNGWAPFPPGSLEFSDRGLPIETIEVALPPSLLNLPALYVRVVAE